MPIIKVEKGDLIAKFRKSQFKAIVHGCNCFNRMGAGIAGQLAREFDEVVEADWETQVGDSGKLGTYTVARTIFGSVINAYTQLYPGKERPEVLYRNIEAVFTDLNDRGEFTKTYDFHSVIGIPLIGCGIAGGDWDVVKEIIDVVTPNLNIVVVEYEKRF